MIRPAATLAALALLAACAEKRGDPLKPEGAVSPTAQPQTPRTPEDEAFANAQRAPQIYMSLQPDPSGPLSIVFAIDAARNDTPQDDPAIRITPEDGKCNPQELRRYNFPADVKRPVFGPDEAFAGVKPEQLPNFMAMIVTSEMMRRGIVNEPEESQPQNVCTRKLWERMIVNEVVTRE